MTSVFCLNANKLLSFFGIKETDHKFYANLLEADCLISVFNILVWPNFTEKCVLPLKLKHIC